MVYVSDYNYLLPNYLIAQKPHYKRGESRLLVLNRHKQSIADKHYTDLPQFFRPGDVVVLNDTKVIKARLKVKNSSGAARELVLLEKHGKQDDWYQHKVVFRGQIKVGELLSIGDNQLEVMQINANGTALIKSPKDLLDIAKTHGTVPLPPYVKRPVSDSDEKTYQTVWAKNNGSVAAPTASLNMTTETLQIMQNKGVKIVYVTLHVGLGTFMPIRSDDLSAHNMHSEYFEVPLQTVKAIQTAKKTGHRVVAVGTTVCRTLEYNFQTLLYEPAKSLTGEADIFIYPGYEFKIVDVMLTNFHAPRSTVLMMAGAFAGWNNLMQAYEHAMSNGYRFLSYGDSMLIV